MAKYEIEKKILNTVCQVCHAVPAKVPLVDLELAPGILFIPDILLCAKCGAQLTVQVREYTKAELEKKKDDALAKAILAEELLTEEALAGTVILDEFAGGVDAETKTENAE